MALAGHFQLPTNRIETRELANGHRDRLKLRFGLASRLATDHWPARPFQGGSASSELRNSRENDRELEANKRRGNSVQRASMASSGQRSVVVE